MRRAEEKIYQERRNDEVGQEEQLWEEKRYDEMKQEERFKHSFIKYNSFLLLDTGETRLFVAIVPWISLHCNNKRQDEKRM